MGCGARSAGIGGTGGTSVFWGKKEEREEVAGVEGSEGFSMGEVADVGADAEPVPELLWFEISKTSEVTGVSSGEEVGLGGSGVL